MARKSQGSIRDQKINTAVNARLGDIFTASKSQNIAESYEKGYPAHDSLHINPNLGGRKAK